MPPLLAEVEGEFGLAAGLLSEALYGGTAWPAAEVGALSYEDYVDATLATLGRVTGSPERGRALWGAWQARFYRREFMPGMLDVVEALRKQVKVAMLSNASPGIERRLRERMGIAHLFDPLVGSAEIGLRKPDPRALQHVLDLLRLPAEECYFVDDTLVNVEGARAMGIRAHHFVADTPALVAALAAEGLHL